MERLCLLAVLAGDLMTLRLESVPATGFVGVKTTDAPGGVGDVRCRLASLVLPADYLTEDDFLYKP